MNTMDKEVRDLELVTEEADPHKIAEDMAIKIRKMYEDRDKKIANARENLVSQLEVTASKYLTANGVMSALETIRTVYGNSNDIHEDIILAKTFAVTMSDLTLRLKKKAEDLENVNEFNALCDNVYDAHYAEDDNDTPADLIVELMILQLCQNVGPNAEDIALFFDHTTQEIIKARGDLHKYCEENDIDFLKLCGEEA